MVQTAEEVLMETETAAVSNGDVVTDDMHILNGAANHQNVSEITVIPDGIDIFDVLENSGHANVNGLKIDSISDYMDNLVEDHVEKTQRDIQETISSLRIDVADSQRRLDESEQLLGGMRENLTALRDLEEQECTREELPPVDIMDVQEELEENGQGGQVDGDGSAREGMAVSVAGLGPPRRSVPGPGRRFTPSPPRQDPGSGLGSATPLAFLRPPRLAAFDKVWAQWDRRSLTTAWAEATVLECSGDQVRVRFTEDKVVMAVSRKQVAAWAEHPVRLGPVGTRVIAQFRNAGEEDNQLAEFYPAVIAELPKQINDNCYLVFYDDGFTDYLEHQELRKVLDQDQDVWKDVAADQRKIIQEYMEAYPDRPMVKLKPGDRIRTSKEGRVLLAEVEEVNASLALVKFPGIEGNELIYRGSARFEPLRKVGAGVAGLQATGRRRRGAVRPVAGRAGRAASYTPHQCSRLCHQMFPYYPSDFKEVNPLRVPLLLGWARQVADVRDLEAGIDCNWHVFYTSPCGKRCRGLEEVHVHLQECSSRLEIDFFAFESWLTVTREFVPCPDFIQLKDISHWKERMPISAANSYDSAFPPLIKYNSEPSPQVGVTILHESGFQVHCDCKDDCDNREVCTCRQLTIQMTECDAGGRRNEEAGYVSRRLQDVVPTGIYECNANCACSTTCLNKLVQFPIRSRLQIFRTENRGWGIRTRDDLPQGTFVCTYAGKLYESGAGNEQGKAFGDTYFADLDMIEVVESRKEGYESDVTDIEAEDSDCSDEEMRQERRKEARKEKEKKFEESGEKPKFKSVRKYFGEDEEPYIMDAMTEGNVGRYLNHSCEPNVFVQNVFIKTHDIRFPTLAFFTTKFVEAGKELVWNYNYEVGSVDNKEITCNCGAKTCKGRLL